jgi:hypothetical protein
MAVLRISSKCSHTIVYAPLFRRTAPCHEPLSTLFKWVLKIGFSLNAVAIHAQ